LFGHVPLILRPDKSKISKRKGDPSVTEYRDLGYLPEALLNYLCLLGWSAGDDREIYSRDELVEAFDLRRVTAANPVFDPAKLEWLNGEYIRSLAVEDLARRLEPLFVAAGRFPAEGPQDRDWLESLVGLLQERCKLLPDFVRQSDYFFEPPRAYDPKGVAKQFEKEGAQERLRQLARVWGETSPFASDNLNEATRALAESNGTKPAPYIHVARLAITGVTAGPGLYELAALLGRDTCIDRLQLAAAAIAEGRVVQRSSATEENG
jgi:glutamyl-tRNA synthetase